MAIVEKVDGFFIPNVTLIGVGAAKAIPERIVYLNATKPLLVTDLQRCRWNHSRNDG